MTSRDYDYEYEDIPSELRPLGAWGYVGLSILYAIPIIGWIFLIIFTFHGGNLNRRSFTRSYWCWLLIVVLLFIIGGAYLMISGKMNDIVEFVSSFTKLANLSTGTPSVNKPNSTNSSISSGGVTPEFKELMDSYEAFMDEYIAFMKSYDASTASGSMIASYSALMSRYADFATKINSVETDNLPDADLAYYVAVNARIEQKLMTSLNSAA